MINIITLQDKLGGDVHMWVLVYSCCFLTGHTYTTHSCYISRLGSED